jgi:hypothetical protein
MVLKKTNCIWRIRGAYAAVHQNGAQLALAGREMDAMTMDTKRLGMQQMVDNYLLLFDADKARATESSSLARHSRHHFGDALLRACDGDCSAPQRACMMVRASTDAHVTVDRTAVPAP